LSFQLPIFIEQLANDCKASKNKIIKSLRPLRLVYLCQELFLMFFREAGKNTFKIALVTENVTLSNPGI